VVCAPFTFRCSHTWYNATLGKSRTNATQRHNLDKSFRFTDLDFVDFIVDRQAATLSADKHKYDNQHKEENQFSKVFHKIDS
jgi:hypothetical protein